MPAFDAATAIVTQLWTLINADGDWQIDPSNEIRYDTVIGTQDPQKPNLNDADFPQARMWVESGRSSMFSGDTSFATEQDGGPSTWVEQQQYVVRLEIVSQLCSTTEIDTEYLEAINAVRSGGPKLGLEWVQRWNASWRNEMVGSDPGQDELEAVRWKATITLIVDCILDNSQLTTN